MQVDFIIFRLQMRKQGLWLSHFPEAAQLLNGVVGFEPNSERSNPIPLPVLFILLSIN